MNQLLDRKLTKKKRRKKILFILLIKLDLHILCNRTRLVFIFRYEELIFIFLKLRDFVLVIYDIVGTC